MFPFPRLCRRREDGLRKPCRFFQARREAHPRNSPFGAVILPSRAAEVSPYNAFHRKGGRLSDQHAPPLQYLFMGGAFFGEVVHVRRDQVVCGDVFHLAKPEGGHLRQNLSLPGDGIGHNDVKGGYPVRCDDKEAVPHFVYIPHLAPAEELQLFEFCGEHGIAFHRESPFYLRNGLFSRSFFMVDVGILP
ncbi:hypothetical protein ES708_31192 [subsurface metagenome]